MRSLLNLRSNLLASVLVLSFFACELLASMPALTQDLMQEDTDTATELVVAEDETPEPNLAVKNRSEAKTSPAPELTPAHQARKRAIERCLSIYYTIQVDADTLRPWSIMHGLIAFGDQTLVQSKGKRISAVQYLCANGIGDDRRLLHAPGGQLKTNIGPGFQGHEGQLLGMLAQANVSSDYPMTVDNHSFLVADLIRHEMLSCRSGSELTFKLLSLSHYLDSDAVWGNETGEQWNFARLLKEELDSPIDETTSCGGTHRLMAVSRAIANRKEQGKAIEGEWVAASEYLEKFRQFAFTFQNNNGSFSTQWFRSRENDPDINRRLYTTGHVLEWLVYSSSDAELTDPRIARAVDYVVNLMLSAPYYQLDVGPRGHALHALRLYEARMYGNSDHQQLMGKQFAQQIELQQKQNLQTSSQIQTQTKHHHQPIQISPRTLPVRHRRGLFGLRR